MRPLQLISALWVVSRKYYANAEIDESAAPIAIPYNTTTPIGPDGPWWAITQTVDSPEQYVNFLPGFSALTLVVNSSACASSDAECPLPMPGMWSDPRVNGALTDMSNETTPADSWGKNQATVLDIEGDGRFNAMNISLRSDNNSVSPVVISDAAVVVSTNYTANFPGGASYTLDTGFLSLYAGVDNEVWANEAGSRSNHNRTIPAAYYQGQIPSMSFGIHVGSVNPPVEGSLVFGGYDQSRCISEPIVSDGGGVQLVDISLGVASGKKSSFIGLPEGTTNGLLQANGSNPGELEIAPNPGLPYLYLPKDTCDAIAKYLPVSFNSDFNLYFWDTESTAYKKIVGSPHFLSFSFAAGGLTRSINVPFALLNLTLDKPLMEKPTPYFPCSPWLPSIAPYFLGRAFLQAAFFAQNWHEKKLFLAQAPGPNLPPSAIRTIKSSDTALSSLPDPPTWESTWADAFTSHSNGSSGSNNTTTTTRAKPHEEGISGGAIAGIVIGVIAGLALVAACIFWRLRNRKRDTTVTSAHFASEEVKPPLQDVKDPSNNIHAVESGGEGVYEADATQRDPVELDSAKVDQKPGTIEREPVELEADREHR